MRCGKDVFGDARGAAEKAILVDVAMIRIAIANLRVVGPAAQRFRFAILEEARTGAPHEIDVAFNVAIADVCLAVDLERVLVAVEVAIREDRSGVQPAVENDRLGLRTALGRRIAQRKNGDRKIPRAMGEEQPAMVDGAAEGRGCAGGGARRNRFPRPVLLKRSLFAYAITVFLRFSPRIVRWCLPAKQINSWYVPFRMKIVTGFSLPSGTTSRAPCTVAKSPLPSAATTIRAGTLTRRRRPRRESPRAASSSLADAAPAAGKTPSSMHT